MASLEFTTNLRLIDGSARTSVPTPEELPLGYMCFGIVNGRASIWGNYDGRVVVSVVCAPRFGIEWVWYSVPMGWFMNFVISFAEYRTGNWKKRL